MVRRYIRDGSPFRENTAGKLGPFSTASFWDRGAPVAASRKLLNAEAIGSYKFVYTGRGVSPGLDGKLNCFPNRFPKTLWRMFERGRSLGGSTGP